MKKLLSQRQVEMKARQLRGRRGRKKRVSKREMLRRRIRSRIFLLEGRTPEFIAAFFNKSPEAVRRWIKRGAPLVDPEPPKKRVPSREVPYYR